MSITFTREDWKMFRNLETLCQKAGVHREYIPRLVIKELVDNALDASGDCRLTAAGSNGFAVSDSGSGMDPDSIETYFSICRPMVSGKLLRLPGRGALGNGLRVVTGAVISTGGTLTVSTRGRSYQVTFHDDGTSSKAEAGPWSGEGTRIEVTFGSVPVTQADFQWGQAAIRMARSGDSRGYRGNSSPWWYTSEAFFELCHAADIDVFQLAGFFQGTDRQTLDRLEERFGLLRLPMTRGLSFEETEDMLDILRANHGAFVKPTALGQAGKGAHPGSYRKQTGTFAIPSARGRHHAEIPFAAETWVEGHPEERKEERSWLWTFVNSTVAATDVKIHYSRREVTLWSGGLYIAMKKARPGIYRFNIVTPYMPITSDGKAPDFRPMNAVIEKAMTAASREEQRSAARTESRGAGNEKEIILANLAAAIEKTSGGGTHIFSLRQLYYGIRPYVMAALDKEPEYNYFCRLISQYENECGEIRGMYRDPRGVLYHPHSGGEMPLGTIAVQNYARPAWTFNKIIFIEKEGYFASLRDVRFPERYDCALITSKGFASRAVKDVFDLLGETEEEITFFCVHDADAAGTMIYETLQNSTISRPGRKFRVINLGLDPEEALEMGLQAETFKQGDRRRPVASYLNWEWGEWLQENRVELNAMTTPQFIDWLERKMAAYGHKKVIPHETVLKQQLQEEAQELLREKLARKLLQEAGFDAHYRQALTVLNGAVAETEGLRGEVEEALAVRQERHWSSPVKGRAEQLIKSMV